ncbi:MAG: hypothetical protein KDI13_04015 [Alphaproteobacteria bacterium]|nr:hypothetical protein [Alphaproteobacteria bacterium]
MAIDLPPADHSLDMGSAFVRQVDVSGLRQNFYRESGVQPAVVSFIHGPNGIESRMEAPLKWGADADQVLASGNVSPEGAEFNYSGPQSII